MTADLSSDVPLPLISVEGTPAECGRAYGRQAADLIAANIQAYGARFAARAGLTTERVRAAGAVFRDATRRYQPRIADLLDGVADGAGVDVDDVYALNGRTELLYGALPGECTSIGVLGERAVTGHTTLAQNWDWHPAQRPYTVLLATRDEHGFGVLTLAEAGMVAKAGLNSAGVGLCLNVLTTDRDGGPGRVPYHVVLRAVLEADCLALSLRAVCGMPRSASVNLLLGQAGGPGPLGTAGGPGPFGTAGGPGPFGTAGEILDVEAVPGDIGVLHPADGLITHANHLLTGVRARDTFADRGGSSYFRAARAARLLGTGKIAESDLAAALADHLSYPHAICRHADPRDGDDDLSESLYSVILDLDERRMSVAAGPSCRNTYAPVLLDKVV